jgi:Flp pilus assembly protein TadG
VSTRFDPSSILRTGRAFVADLLFHVRHELPRFKSDRRGNVAMIFALCSIPILFAVGAGIDYTNATRRKAKLDAIADTVALSTVTLSGNKPAYSPIPGEGLDAQDAQARAATMFTSLASAVTGVSGFTGTVTVTDGTSTGGSTTCTASGCQTTPPPSGGSTSRQPPRTATVNYTANSIDAFGGIIGMRTIPIGNGAGGTVAQVSIAPNINFYILADSSPSMAIPASATGVSSMYTATSSGSGTGGDNEGGCSFACHEADYSKWVLPGNASCIGVNSNTGSVTTGSGSHKTTTTFTYYTNGTAVKPGMVDDYTYAECVLGLTLRIDNLRAAIQQLGPYANNMSVGTGSQPGNGAAYQMGVATFDTDWTTSPCQSGHNPLHYITGLTSGTPQYVALQAMNTASTSAASIQMLQMFNNGGLSGVNQTSSTTSGQYQTTCSNNDGSTALNAALTQMNSMMPTPGNGTNIGNDTPQEVLMLITDGVNDVQVSGGGRTISTISAAQCNTIKARVSSAGLPIQIAVLYLNYSPLPNNSFYNSNVEPIDNNSAGPPNPNIATALQSCASTPSLYTEVTDDADITAALESLFTTAANQAARLSQ